MRVVGMNVGDSTATVERLDDQIKYYNRRSVRSQRLFKWLKGVEIVAATLIPFAAGFDVPRLATGLLGILVVVLEGVQNLNQYQRNWLNYRSTCEALRHEKYLWLAKAGPYADASRPDALLAERTEGLISHEHAKWVTGRERAEEIEVSRHVQG